MGKNKKLALILIYYSLFMFSVFLLLRVSGDIARGERFILSLGNNLLISSIDDIIELRFLIRLVSFLLVMTASFMIGAIISYNFDLLKKKGTSLETEVRELIREGEA